MKLTQKTNRYEMLIVVIIHGDRMRCLKGNFVSIQNAFLNHIKTRITRHLDCDPIVRVMDQLNESI